MTTKGNPMTYICADCGRVIDSWTHLCVRDPDPLGRYDGNRGDLVPGYAESADGLADAKDQRKADKS